MQPRGVTTRETWWKEPCMAYNQNNYYTNGPTTDIGLTHTRQINSQINYCNDGMYDHSDYFSSSPALTTGGHNISSRSRDNTDAPRNCEFIEFFGEEFAGMEETFRSALLQYFTQVDKERQDLAEELELIRSDFCRFQEQTQGTIEQKEKTIRQLTENGKCLISEIERIKEEMSEGEMLRQQIISENNELQKQIGHENVMIPHLENELKSLAEENDYLKLLADDTKKLSQQENEIRQYSNELYRQKKICHQQSEKISKQTQAFQNLSKINDELCIKINQLASLQNADKKLEEKNKQHNILAGEYHALQLNHSNLNNRFEELKQLVDSLESERNEVQKEKDVLADKYEMLNSNFERKCKELEEISEMNEEKEGRSSEYLETIKELENENKHLKNENGHSHREIKNLQHQLDDLVYEDNLRNDDCANLQHHVEILQMRCDEYYSKENELKRELDGKTQQLTDFTLKEEGYRHKIKCMETHSNGNEDSVKMMEIKVERLQGREKQLETEILGHVKTQAEGEQEITLMYHTIETLKRNNETCNNQRAQLQKEVQSLQVIIKEYESQNVDRKTEIELRKELQGVTEKHQDSEDQRFALQNEVFILKRQLNGIKSIGENSSLINSSEQQTTQSINKSSITLNYSSIIHHLQNESGINGGYSCADYNGCINKESISCADLKVFSQKKEEEIEILIDQRNRYQEECRLLFEEIDCLKDNYEAVENKLDEHNQYIDNLTGQCSKLQDQIQTRNHLINQQEEDIERLQSDIVNPVRIDDDNKDGNAIKEIQDYSINLNRELLEKNQEIEDLQIHYKQLQQVLNSKQQEIDVIKRNRACTGQDGITEQELLEDCQILKEKVLELQEENFEKTVQIQQLEKSFPRDTESISIEPELRASSVISIAGGSDINLQARIKELEEEVEQLNENQLSNGHQENQNCFDYSYEDENLISKQKYQDLEDAVKNKELIISDLKEHISLIELEYRNANLQRKLAESVSASKEMTEPTAAPGLGLRLPSPDITAARKNSFSFHTKRNSLPPLPTKSKESTKSLDRSETVDGAMREKRADTSLEEMRGKVIKLNSELLEKKMTINKLEEELKITRKKYARLEDSHRTTIDKNESIELDIIENRKKINNVQTKQTSNVANEMQYRKEVQTYRANSERLQDQCKELRRDRDQLQHQVNEQRADQKILESKLEQSERQLNQWRNNNKVLEHECESTTSKCEKMQSEMLCCRDKIYELNRECEILQGEKDSWKRTIETKTQQIGCLNNETEALQEEIRNKAKAGEKFYEQLRIIEQERDIFETKVKDDRHTIEKLDQRIKSQSEEIEQLNFQIQEWRVKMESNFMENKELLSVKEINEQNTKYLESKLDETRIQVKEKNDVNRSLKDENESLKNEIRKLSEELKYANVDVENIKEEYTNGNKNVLNLEKLNKDMNKENRKLMLDITEAQQRVKMVAEECEHYKNVIKKMENEQIGLDKMLIKTQKSNSELLESYTITKDDLKGAHSKIIHLQNELEADEKKHIVMENKLLSIEKEFESTTRNTEQENKDMSVELQQSRKLISEFEAILDQGQLDFDEMDTHLERYRNENSELDKRLHEALKLQIRLQSERENLDRKAEDIMEEMGLLREGFDKERKFSETCMKEKDDIELELQEAKAKEEMYEQEIVNLQTELNTKMNLLETKDSQIEELQRGLDEQKRELSQVHSQLDSIRSTSLPKIPHQETRVESIQSTEVEEIRKQYEECRKALHEKQQNLHEYSKTIQQFKSSKELHDDHMNELLSQIQCLETELEEQKDNREKDVEDCLREVSDLRSHIADQEVANEKTVYDNRKLEYELSEVLERNERLADKLDSVLNETDLERNAMIETIAHLEEQVNSMEDNTGNDLQHLQTAIQELEELRQQDEQSFEKALESSRKDISTKEKEIRALREDVVQLKTALDDYESKNVNLANSMSTFENEEKLVKAKLMQDVRSQEQSIQMLREKSSVEGEHKSSLLLEVERLTKEVDRLHETNANLQQESSQELKLMRDRVEDLTKSQYLMENLKTENENLKSDIEYFLSDRKDYQSRYQEISQLRAEIANLRFKQRRMEDLTAENHRLKQEVKSNTSENGTPATNQDNNSYQLLNENRKLKLEIEKLSAQKPGQSPSNDELVRENKRLMEELTRKESIPMRDPRDYQLLSENNKLKLELETILEQGTNSSNSELLDSLTRENQQLRDENQRLENSISIDQYQGIAGNSPELVNSLTRENKQMKNEIQQLQSLRAENINQRSVGYDSELVNSLTQENKQLKNEIQQLQSLRAENINHRSGGYDPELVNSLTRENKQLKNENQQLRDQGPAGQNQVAGGNNNFLDSLARENKELKNEIQQLQNLKSENQDLQSKTRRLNELNNENRMLNQELRAIENKHISANEKLKEENTHLKKRVDELFKKNQDLELSNISPVHTIKPQQTESFQARSNEPLTFKQKAASFDNLSQASWKKQDLSSPAAPLKNPVLANTSNQEQVTYFFGNTPTKATSYERLPTLNNQIKQHSATDLPSLLYQNQDEKARSMERIPSFSSQTGPSEGPFIKQMKVKFAGNQQPDGGKDIKTSPQVKSILNPYQNQQVNYQKAPLERIFPKNTSSNQPTQFNNISSKPNVNVLKDRPDVSQFSLIAFDEDPHLVPQAKATPPPPPPRTDSIQQQHEDNNSFTSSWLSPELGVGELKRTPSIKNNPFFELDRSSSQSRWKQATAMHGQSKSANNSPTKPKYSQSSIPKDVTMFDMRPQSTEPTIVPTQRKHVESTEETNENGIGNEFVKRLKGVFEGRPVKGR